MPRPPLAHPAATANDGRTGDDCSRVIGRTSGVSFLAQEPDQLLHVQAARSDALYRARWLSLLSVDDLVHDTVSMLERLGALVSAKCTAWPLPLSYLVLITFLTVTPQPRRHPFLEQHVPTLYF